VSDPDQPAVGDAVLYTLSAYDARTANEQQQADVAVAGAAYPATVTAVPDGPVTPASTADLTVQIADGVEYLATSRTRSDGAGYWAWPPEWS
jgi:hypothetical protein